MGCKVINVLQLHQHDTPIEGGMRDVVTFTLTFVVAWVLVLHKHIWFEYFWCPFDAHTSIDQFIVFLLSVRLSVANFNLRYDFYCKRQRLNIWHAYSTYNTLSNDTKVNDIVTLTVTFVLK